MSQEKENEKANKKATEQQDTAAFEAKPASEDNSSFSFVKELTEVVTGFVARQSKPAETDPVVDKLFAHQQEGKLRELQQLQARIQEALPGEQKKLQRKLTLYVKSRAEQQKFLLAQQDKLEAELEQSPLHATFESLSVHAVTPEQMWQHYASLRPGATGLVYAYQLKRELYAMLETALEKLEAQSEEEPSKEGAECNNGTKSTLASSSNPAAPTSSSGELGGSPAAAKTGRPVVKMVDRTFHELFVHKQEATRILALLLEKQIIQPDHSWKGSTHLKTEIASLAQVLQMKGYFKTCSSRELARVFNAYFRVSLDISSYRKPTNEEVERYYRRLIAKSS